MIWCGLLRGKKCSRFMDIKVSVYLKPKKELTQYPRPRGSKIGDPIYEEVEKGFDVKFR